MSHYNRKKSLCLILLALLLVELCGCQQKPDTQAVVSRNDGAFDSAIIQPATEPTKMLEKNIQLSETFSSTDESVNFYIQLTESYPVQKMPVVEVVPHFFTGEEAGKIASILFENADFWETPKTSTPTYSKDVLQKMITRWSAYTNAEHFLELYGDTRDPASDLEIVQNYILEYTQKMETAPEVSPQPCEWDFTNEAYYMFDEAELSEKMLSEYNDAIWATTQIDGLEYVFHVSIRNKDDYKISTISCYPNNVGPINIDTRIFESTLCRTAEPTDTQICAVKEKTQDMLNQMGVGQWLVDNATVQTTYYGTTPEYKIEVTAIPVIEETLVIRRPQLGNLKSEASFASNYYHTDASFEFSADGKLLRFYMTSPVDILQVLNDNVATQNLEELLELAKNHLALSEASAYGMGEESIQLMEKASGEPLICNVNIETMDYGLLRVKVPNTDDSYYFVPGILLSGTAEYVGKISGELFRTVKNRPLVAINGIDGSHIELSN